MFAVPGDAIERDDTSGSSMQTNTYNKLDNQCFQPPAIYRPITAEVSLCWCSTNPTRNCLVSALSYSYSLVTTILGVDLFSGSL